MDYSNAQHLLLDRRQQRVRSTHSTDICP